MEYVLEENKYRVLRSCDGDPFIKRVLEGDPFIKRVPEVDKPVGPPEA